MFRLLTLTAAFFSASIMLFSDTCRAVDCESEYCNEDQLTAHSNALFDEAKKTLSNPNASRAQKEKAREVFDSMSNMREYDSKGNARW